MRGDREKERVCVTGAGGYVASWLVKFLLSKGYLVHGTVRDPCDEKNAHLKKLENASENMQLFKADLLDYEGLCAAIAGCTGVFHVACPVPAFGPVPNPEVEVIKPAVTGTRNVLNACVKAKVEKVVVVSSIAAVVNNPNWPADQAMHEECWSDIEFAKSVELWYCVGKTISETEAFEYAKSSGLNLITVCPSIAIGPLLQSTLNASSLYLLKFLNGERESMESRVRAFVDVRDVAEALLLVYEKPDVEGRYICSSFEIQTQDLVKKLKTMYPNYNYPKSFIEEVGRANLSSEKLQNLGWKCRPFEESIVDAVMNFEEIGVLGKTTSE